MAFADESPICTSSTGLCFPIGVSSSRSDLSVPSHGWLLALLKKRCWLFCDSPRAACQVVQAVDQHGRKPGLGIPQDVRQFLEQSPMALGENESKLVEQASKFIGLHDAHLHELSTQAMQCQNDLLRVALDGNGPHARLAACCPAPAPGECARPMG